MFRNLRLCESFEYVLPPAVWKWFGPMAMRGAAHYGLDGWTLFEQWQMQRYSDVWRQASEAVLTKLRSGEWSAHGISPAYGPQMVQIDTDLWEYLRLKERLEEAEGFGFHFIALAVTSNEPAVVRITQAETGTLRAQLTRWLKQFAESVDRPQLRIEQLEAAREAFLGQEISDNMFRECRRAAGLSSRHIQVGRPKLKGSNK